MRDATFDMTVGSPTKGIVRFALPLVMGYILQQMYLVTDAAIVGRWVGVNALAAVGASSSVMFLVLGFCNGVCAGFSIPVAQAFGGKQERLMRSFVANALRLALMLSLGITLVACLSCGVILRILNTPVEIFHDAAVFLLLQFLAIPFVMAYNLFACLIRALGNSRKPFHFLVVASLLNIVLDIVFIVVCRMGVVGAGVATCLAQAFAAWLCWRYIRSEMRVLVPQGSERRCNTHLMHQLLGAGIPMGLQFSITGIGIIMLQSANNALGTSCVAAFTASMRVKYLFTCVFENIGVAMATFCGQNVGAGRYDRVAAGVRSALLVMLAYFVFTFAVIWPFADDMMLLFVQVDEGGAPAMEIVGKAALFMRVACCFYPVLGVLTILRYSIQGMGYAQLSVFSGVMEMLARCGVSLWLVPAYGFLGVCYGDPVAWLSADVFLIPAFLWAYSKKK